MMSNQGDTFGGPLDINQIQWALRHGQKIDGVESIVLSNQPVAVSDNRVSNRVDNNRVDTNSAPEKNPLHNRLLEEQIDQLGQSLNREIVSLKGEFAIVAQGTGLEEKIDKLEQSLSKEIISLKSELANIAQGTALEEQIEQLGQSLNQEFLSLKSELVIADQNTVLEEQIDKLGQSLNQEILSLKSELAIVAQGTPVEEQIDQLGQSLNQGILSLRNEFAMFVQVQLNQEKAWKMAEVDCKSSLKDSETQLQADMQEMQHNILGKLDEHFRYVDEQMQYNDNLLKQEISLLTAQLAAFQQTQNSEEQVRINQWQKKMEERQNRLLEDMGYIQYVVEEIATRPHSIEGQQKLRENFFIRELSAMKEEIASVCQKCKSQEKGCMMSDVQKYNNSTTQQEINLDSDDQTKIYKRKKKRR